MRLNGRFWSFGAGWLFLVALVFAGWSGSALGGGNIAFSKAFNPDTIGPGSVTSLEFSISNPDTGTTITDIAFIDALPAGVTIADPARAATDCPDALLSAPDGGSTISFSGGRLGRFDSCTATVDVTSNTFGTHMNVTGDLTSSFGNAGTASDDLNVVSTLPGFRKSFAPGSVTLGGRSTLTLTIDNGVNDANVDNLDFTDTLPVGMIIASPPNATTNCGTTTIPASLFAQAGGSVIVLDADGTFSFPAVASGSICTVTVDVVSTGTGMLDNVSGDLLANFVSAGKASATLEVTVTPLAIQKSFTDDPTPPGESVTLEFRIDNFDRDFPATSVAFSDDLSAVLPGVPDLIFDSLLSNDCGGSLSGAGTSNLMFSGGTVAPESFCTISVSLSVPAGATPGTYTNSSSAITGTIDGAPLIGNVASDDLFVQPAPRLTKLFIGDPVGAGDELTLRFTVTNTSATSGATDIRFVDELTDASGANPPDLTSGFLPFPVSVTLPPVPDPPCGGGSSLALVSVGNDRQGLELTGGSLAAAGMAGDACTFEVTLSIPTGFPAGTYLNTTEVITANVDGEIRTGAPASDDIVVVAAPTLAKSFTDDPVDPGGTVSLQFTLTHEDTAPGDATGVTFTDDLSAVLSGLAASAGQLPLTGLCPAGNGSLTGSAGDTLLTFAGATLAPGDVCTLSLTLDVPAAVAAGDYPNTTSDVVATVLGATARENPATDDLRISGLQLSKEFLTNPVIPGESVSLRFTLENMHPTDDATGIQFFDDLSAVLPGTPDISSPAPPTVNTCGGTEGGFATLLFYSGGSLTAGQTCTIEYDIDVPAGAPDGTFNNVTGSVNATMGGNSLTFDPASGALSIDSNRIALAKAFINDPVAPGDAVTLEFTLSNLDAARPVSGIDFSDDLSAMLPGTPDLTFDSVLLNDCGATVTGTGTSLVSVTGAALGADGACTIRVSLTVPSATAANTYVNTTTFMTGTIDGFAVSGDPASDTLEVRNPLVFDKSFEGPTTATGTARLTFTITNPNPSEASELSFLDDLGAVIPGLTAASLPPEPCGAGSAITGTSVLTLRDGTLSGGGTCAFDVVLAVPVTATAGTFLNTTSELHQAGQPVADPATADLVIEPPPTFAKAFAPNPIDAGQVSTLTFTIDNGASALATSNLSFTDTLPAGLVVAAPPGASSSCTGGIITATAGGNQFAYSGGSVAAGGACTLQANVTSDTPDSYLNSSGDLTSSSGNSGPAADTLTVNPARLDLAISVTNNVNEVIDLDITDYMVTVDNLLTAQAVGAQVSLPLPSAVASATWDCVAVGGASCAPAGTDAIDDTVTMPPGSMLTYTWSAAVAKTVETQIDVTATVTAPMGLVDEDLGNNTATDSDPLIEQFVFRSGFEDGEGMVVKRSLGHALLSDSLLQAANAQPTLALRVVDDQGQSVLLVHQRRSAGQLQVRVAHREDGTWAIGRWRAVAPAGGVRISWPW